MVKDTYERTVTHKEYSKRQTKRLKKRTLKKQIIKEPDAHNLIEGKHSDFYIRKDDEIEAISLKKNSRIGSYWAIGISSLIILTYFISPTDERNWFTNMLLISSILAISLSIYYILNTPERRLIFDRKNGVITIPMYFYYKDITMRFDDAFLWKSGGFTGSTISGLRLSVIRPDFIATHTYIGGSYGLYESVAYRVWYMDKNRPLPPGTAFDPYRQKDFERRKAEGFPASSVSKLYPYSRGNTRTTSRTRKILGRNL